MRAGKLRFRHELKFRIHEGECAALRLRMEPYFRIDENARNGSYMIRSLYFDDLWNSAYEEKEMGIYGRKKYRIRIYDCSDNFIRLERKTKLGAYIYKESAKLNRESVERILNGDYDFLLRDTQSLCQEFYYECKSRGMRPKVLVDYDREPFLLDEGTVRVTFDRGVRAAVGGMDIFDPELPTLSVMEPGSLIMEIKFTEFLPDIVRTLVPPGASEYTALSKYVLCYEKTKYLRGFDYWDEGGTSRYRREPERENRGVK